MGFNLNWQMFASMATPFIRAAGIAKENEDTNATGKDDQIGMTLVYIADLLDSLIQGTTQPKIPDSLKNA